MELKKSNRANLEKKRRYFIEIGFIIALILVYFTINFTFAEGKPLDLGVSGADPIEQNIIPITEQHTEQQKKLPPPPPEKKTEDIEIVDNNDKIEKPAKAEPKVTDPKTVIEPVPVPEPAAKSDKIFIMVQRMPAMKGCDKLPSEAERKACTDKKMYQHFAKVQRFPEMAKETGIQGKVYISFVVNTKGKVTDVEIQHAVAGGDALSKEAKRMVNSLPDFSPGKQRGREVSVKYQIPINFELRSR